MLHGLAISGALTNRLMTNAAGTFGSVGSTAGAAGAGAGAAACGLAAGAGVGAGAGAGCVEVGFAATAFFAISSSFALTCGFGAASPPPPRSHLIAPTR